MGQKVHPYGNRVPFIKGWNSVWYRNNKDYPQVLYADLKARKYLKAQLSQAGVGKIEFRRPSKNVEIIIHAARPGTIIGKQGGGVDALRAEMSKLLQAPVHISIQEIRRPELNALLVAENIADQLEHRVMFRRAMKRAVTSALRLGAKGVKICVSGRLGGAEIARSEWYREGRVPLHTLRADIDYGVATAKTTYGVIGVKVWIFKGEILTQKDKQNPDKKHEQQKAS